MRWCVRYHRDEQRAPAIELDDEHGVLPALTRELCVVARVDRRDALGMRAIITGSAEAAHTRDEDCNNHPPIVHLRNVLLGNRLWGSSGVVPGSTQLPI